MSEAFDQFMAHLEADERTGMAMFARCAIRQWAGLSALERNSIERMWAAGRTPMLRTQYEKASFPIWMVPRGWPAPGPLVLLSVKYDAP